MMDDHMTSYGPATQLWPETSEKTCICYSVLIQCSQRPRPVGGFPSLPSNRELIGLKVSKDPQI